MRRKLAVTSIETSNSGETWLTVRVPAGVTVPSIFDSSWSVEMTTPDTGNLIPTFTRLEQGAEIRRCMNCLAITWVHPHTEGTCRTRESFQGITR